MHCITPVVKFGPVRLSMLSVRVMKKLKFIEIFVIVWSSLLISIQVSSATAAATQARLW